MKHTLPVLLSALVLVSSGGQADAGGLAWDAVSKDFRPEPGATNFTFSYAFTNASQTDVVILAVKPSCGCTAVQTPAMPWRIPPGSNGVVAAAIDLRGKWGTLNKTITVVLPTESTHLVARFHLIGAPPVATGPAPMDERERNQLLAQADRQIVFRGDCATCHSEPARDKLGGELYLAACSNCHDSPNRATMVPDLRALNKPTPELYWQIWIRNGREQSLMPAFGTQHGGPLSEAQIVSLSQWLVREFQPKAATAGSTK